jgi:dihydrofolate reductase
MIKAIVAMNHRRVIGINNQLPWHNKEDLQHFKETTLHQAVVMGRKTFESLKKPLPNRTNYVLTTQADYSAPGIIVIHEIDTLLKQYQSQKDLYVIGGATLYELLLPFCQELIVSYIAGEYKGDAFFPEFESQFWLEKTIEKETFTLAYYRRGEGHV